MRRLLAACGAAALSMAVVIPLAHADQADKTHQMDWWTPYDQQGNIKPQTAPDYRDPSGGPVSGPNQVVTVRVNFPDGLKSWQVIIQPEAGGTPSTCSEDFAPPKNGAYPVGNIYLFCPWDTTRAVDRTLDQPTPSAQAPTMYDYDHNWHLNDHGASANGKYAIEVKAWSAAQSCLIGCTYGTPIEYDLFQDYNATPQRWREVYVTNGIADPTGVGAGYDAGSGKVNVTWAPNPEPDVTYLVQEKVGDGGWAPVGTVPASATNFVRPISQPGKYQYQVAAMRPAPTADSGQGASATVTSKYVAAQAVTVNAVSPPTPAAAGSGAPGAPAAGAPDGSNGFIDHSGDNGVVASGGAPSTTGPAGSHVPGSAKGTPSTAHSTGSTSSSGGSAGAAAGEAEGEGADTGFSSTLPYSQNGAADGLGSGDSESPGGESMTPLVNVPRPQDARALLIPLAGALAMFVLAAQGMYLLRRRTPITAGGGLAIEDDFDDWMGY